MSHILYLSSTVSIFPLKLFEELYNGNSLTYQPPHKREHLYSHLHNTHSRIYSNCIDKQKHLFPILCYYFCFEARELGAARERHTQKPPLKAFHISFRAHATKWGCLGCIQIIINTLFMLNRVTSGVVLTQLQQASSSTSQQVPLNYSSHRKQTPHKGERESISLLFKIKAIFLHLIR